MKRTCRMLPAVIAVSVVLLLPAAASASTASVTGGVLYYTAAAGELNNLSVSYPNGVYTLYDTGASTMTAGSGCAPAGSHTLTCGSIGSLTAMSIDLGDQNDVENSQLLFVTPITVHGGAGNDTISTGGANDYLDGGPGNDTLDGGWGNDTLDGGVGADVLRGSAGFDTVTYGDRVAPITASIDGQANDGEAGEGDNIATDVESIVGSSAGDNLTGGTGNDVLVGGGGNDTLSGLGGNDTLDGGAGSDRLDGGAGADTLKAKDGEVDNLSCGSETDVVQSDPNDVVAADCEGVNPPGGDSGSGTAGTGAGGAGAGAPGGGLVGTTVIQPPAVKIATTQATLTASGAVAIKLACPKDIFDGCAGTITLEIEMGGSSAKKVSMARRRKVVKLATRHFKIAAGRSSTLVVHMSRRGRRFFDRHPRAKVIATVSIKNATGVTTTTRKITVKRGGYAHAPGARGRHR